MIVATYNRSNVLRHALESLVRQTYTDWEALVVGDACTDDSEHVVSAFADRRIRWLNLEHNFGDQSGPNSVGARLACGTYLAWLNHDDLWLPEHLAFLVAEARRYRADFVATGFVAVGPHEPESLAAGRISAELWNPERQHSLRPERFYPASTWLVHRELVRSIGDWRRPGELRAVPSQDVVYRCWASGARMIATGRPTVIAIQSGRFEGAYANRRSLEHEALAPRVAAESADALLESLLLSSHASQAPLRDRVARARLQRQMPSKVARALARHTAMPVAARLGLGPHEFLGWLDRRSRGAIMADLRRRRGLVDPTSDGG